jgi:hypothetical protein
MHAAAERRWLARVHGGSYLATGIWSIVHRRSFETVTGSKTDYWLVRTVGALVSVIGATLLLGSRRSQTPPEVVMLAVGSALSLSAVDVVSVAQRRISPVYLLDALGELALVIAWMRVWRRSAARERLCMTHRCAA